MSFKASYNIFNFKFNLFTQAQNFKDQSHLKYSAAYLRCKIYLLEKKKKGFCFFTQFGPYSKNRVFCVNHIKKKLLLNCTAPYDHESPVIFHRRFQFPVPLITTLGNFLFERTQFLQFGSNLQRLEI